jgi:hypothetical protein
MQPPPLSHVQEAYRRPKYVHHPSPPFHAASFLPTGPTLRARPQCFKLNVPDCPPTSAAAKPLECTNKSADESKQDSTSGVSPEVPTLPQPRLAPNAHWSVWLHIPSVHHPYTIRTPSVHDPYTMRTRSVHHPYTMGTRCIVPTGPRQPFWTQAIRSRPSAGGQGLGWEGGRRRQGSLIGPSVSSPRRRVCHPGIAVLYYLALMSGLRPGR